ncbi:MAG: twin-arginine translocation signal domain-containing protein, partial [Terriglobales bacterium]
MPKFTRRDFLKTSCCTAAGVAATSFSRFGLMNAYAQGTDYKALVCIFLFGGNDANNMIIPYDKAGYMNYQSLRAN